MTLSALPLTLPAPADNRIEPFAGRARSLYRALLLEQGDRPGSPDRFTLAASEDFVRDRLSVAARDAPELPVDLAHLATWLDQSTATVRREWRAYLDARRDGASRRYFRTRAHALHTLRTVSPTKLVDGAWLYGLLRHRDDWRLHGLIRTYLEELGDGVPAHNHVAIYRQLLTANGCEQVDGLDDEWYVQGAIQLALGHHVEAFLPEVIGFNLGYEQLPLHLLVMAHELRELGVDPTYFSLHVTIDNAATGHARRALDAVAQNHARTGDGAGFHRRMRAGYALNSTGRSTGDAIASFDADRELVAVLRRKALHGAELHSDRCRVAGRTINEWLAEPSRMPEFLGALESTGWIRRGSDPRESRFWHLLQGERAPMFGVFDGYERQLIEDWIGGEDAAARKRFAPPAARRAPPLDTAASAPARTGVDDIDAESRALLASLGAAGDDADAMAVLIGWMSPARHPSPTGLLATRRFVDLTTRTM